MVLSRVCLAALPALEADGSRITVQTISHLSDVEIRIDYETYQDGAFERGVAVCAYGLDRATGKQTALVGIDTHYGQLSDTQLWTLNRFWLAQPGRINEAIDMLTFKDEDKTASIWPIDNLLALLDGG